MSEQDRTMSISLGRRQRTLLRSIIDSIEAIGDPAGDPAAQRLFPPISDDGAVAADYADMTHEDLRSLRNDDRATFDAVMERASGSTLALTVSEADACARTVGTARIAMAARLGLFDDPIPSVSMTSRAAVDFLGYVQDRMVSALLADLPDSQGPTTESH